MTELLPCPFCGGEAKVAIGQGQNDGHGYIVFCDRCWVSQSYLDKTEAEAIAAWNSRAERTCHITNHYGDWYCESCGELVGTFDTTSELYIDCNAIELWDYCPRCGAKVVG